MTIGTCFSRTGDLGLLGSSGVVDRSKESCGEDPAVDVEKARGTTGSDLDREGCFLSRVNAATQEREDNGVDCFLTDLVFSPDLLRSKDRPAADWVSEVEVDG